MHVLSVCEWAWWGLWGATLGWVCAKFWVGWSGIVHFIYYNKLDCTTGLELNFGLNILVWPDIGQISMWTLKKLNFSTLRWKAVVLSTVQAACSTFQSALSFNTGAILPPCVHINILHPCNCYYPPILRLTFPSKNHLVVLSSELISTTSGTHLSSL